LKNMGFNRRISCSSESTTIFRVGVIAIAHRLVHLPFDDDQKADLFNRLHIEWVRAGSALAMERNVPTGRGIVLQLRRACPDTRDGVRCAAMVTLLQYLGTKQLAALQFGDLTPGYVAKNKTQPLLRVVEIHIREPINRFQAIFSKPRVFGADADSVVLWGRVRLYDEFGEGIETAPPELPFLVRDRKNGASPVSGKWVSSQLSEIILNAGLESILNSTRRRYWASVVRLRCQRESENQRKLMEMSQRAGLSSMGSVYDILRNPPR